MKTVFEGFMLQRDSSVESFNPILMKTVARFVYFEDGTNLNDEWKSFKEQHVPLGVYDESVTVQRGDVSWRILMTGDNHFIMTCRFRDTVNNAGEALKDTPSELMTIIDNNATRYTFTIPMPKSWIPLGTHIDQGNTSASATIGSECVFAKKGCLYTVHTQMTDQQVAIRVDHYDGVDSIDLSQEETLYIDFSVIISGIVTK